MKRILSRFSPNREIEGTDGRFDDQDRHGYNSKVDIDAMHSLVLLAQLLVQDAGFEQWVDSRNPAELCEIDASGLIDDTLLPGGRAQSPCSNGNGDNSLESIPESLELSPE